MEKIQDSLFGKTSSEPSRPQRDRTSRASSRKSSASGSRKRPKCLCLKRDGRSLTFFWETDGASLTAFLTLNFSESPSAAAVYTLSRTLLADVQGKYYLSPRACRGILRRASARGKTLPEPLRIALEQQAQEEE